VYGVMLGFAYYWPQEHIYIWGVIPIQARWFVLLMTAFSLFGGFTGSEDGVAHFAHLGGFFGGFLYLRSLGNRPMTEQTQAPADVQEKQEINLEQWLTIPKEKLHPVNREELERILRKLQETGVRSLTSGEITFLNRFSSQ
jgi:hypothetical protein